MVFSKGARNLKLRHWIEYVSSDTVLSRARLITQLNDVLPQHSFAVFGYVACLGDRVPSNMALLGKFSYVES